MLYTYTIINIDCKNNCDKEIKRDKIIRISTRIFCDTKQCNALMISPRLGTCYRIHTWFISKPEKGCNIFLRTHVRFSTDYTKLYLRREKSS